MKKLVSLLAPSALAFLALGTAVCANPALAQTRSVVSVGQAGTVPRPAAIVLTGTERTAALTAASRALGTVRSVQGRFTQLAPNGGRTAGTYYLQRPGRARFEYDSPAPLLIVSDGTTVAIHDRELRNTDRAPLRSTPLFFVLKNNPNLDADFRITRVARAGDLLQITARDRDGEIDGELTLTLQGPNMALQSWAAVDATGATTTVRLDTMTTVARLNPRLFIADDLQDPTNRRR
ncbi:MAG: LolA family protein [Caulobacterales bacterium]|jgi:outer membrane lipoprotein-sorting protein